MKQSTKYLKIFCNLAFALAVLLIIIFLLPKLLIFFMPFVVGFILSLIANPLVRFLEKKIKIKRKYGTMLIIIFVIALVVLLGYGIFAGLAVGIRSFMDYLPTMSANAETEIVTAIESIETAVRKVPLFKDFQIDQVENAVKDALGNLMTGTDSVTITTIGGIAKNIPGMLVNAVIGFLATYFFIADHDKIAGLLERRKSEAKRS